MTEWFISGNPKKYNLIDAFSDLGKVDWKQSTNVEKGDIVYIYVSADKQCMPFLQVLKTNRQLKNWPASLRNLLFLCFRNTSTRIIRRLGTLNVW